MLNIIVNASFSLAPIKEFVLGHESDKTFSTLKQAFSELLNGNGSLFTPVEKSDGIYCPDEILRSNGDVNTVTYFNPIEGFKWLGTDSKWRRLVKFGADPVVLVALYSLMTLWYFYPSTVEAYNNLDSSTRKNGCVEFKELDWIFSISSIQVRSLVESLQNMDTKALPD